MINNKKRFILVYAQAAAGGIAEHVHYQCEALSDQGISVVMLTSTDFIKSSQKYKIKHALVSQPNGTGNCKKIVRVFIQTLNEYILAWNIIILRPDMVLLDSYKEYYSLLWFFPHYILKIICNVKYCVNLHDPIRNLVLGHIYWHKLSIYLAYLPINYGVIHQKIDTYQHIPKHVKVIEAPVGVYEVAKSYLDPADLKKQWNFSHNTKIFLAFGFVRNNKNIDLFLRAMQEFDDIALVVAGTVPSERDHPIDYYKNLAQTLGIIDRVIFDEKFISDTDIEAYFISSDYILLTYNSLFVSQSGVLNIAACLKKLCLCSSGHSSLKYSVEKYNLGVFVEPDNVEALRQGLRKLLNGKINPNWDSYAEYASWKTNVSCIIKNVFDI